MRSPAPSPSLDPSRPIIVWFREDLRLADNPALHVAAETGAEVLCLFVLDEVGAGLRPRGGASRWWLHGSLSALCGSLKQIGAALILRRGSAETIIPDLAMETRAGAVFWNRRYGDGERRADDAIQSTLARSGVEVRTFGAKLLHEPWEVRTKAGGPFRVFTPFWRAAQEVVPPSPLPAPDRIRGGRPQPGDALDNWGLRPRRPDWAGGLRETWQPGEASAQRRLRAFLDERFDAYAEDRDFPAKDGSSGLSPHLAFGEIGPRQIWAALADYPSTASRRKLQSEIGWRDFSWHLLAHIPALPRENFHRSFDAFAWAEPGEALAPWQHGRTGYPIVDAAMRQLWRTGWMHNRLRMIAGSFLVKDLLIDWRRGEEWFWDTLVDADPASNAVNWQWIAGAGPDPAPFFRIFNPVLQGRKFDPQGAFVRRYVPELAALPDQHVHEPWAAPAAVLAKAGVELGRSYPERVVEHGFARARALSALAVMRSR